MPTAYATEEEEIMSSFSNKRSAEELRLLQGITSTLESNQQNQNNENNIVIPPPAASVSAHSYSKTLLPKQTQASSSFVDRTQNATKNLLAEKALIKSITNACVAEGLAATNTFIIQEIVEKYKVDYAKLTVEKVTESIARQPEATSIHETDTQVVEAGVMKVGKCIELIDEDMKQYYIKITQLKARRRLKEEKIAARAKRKREKAAVKAATAAASTEDGIVAASQEEAAADVSAKKPAKKKQRRTRTKKKVSDWDDDDALYEEMTERYYKAKEANEQLPSRELERIIAETKRDMHREDFDKPYRTVYNEIKKRWMKRGDVGATADGEITKRTKEMYEELYKRYCEMKTSQQKLSRCSFAELSKSVKEEFGLPDDLAIKKNRITYRYRREHPEHKSNPEHVVEIRKLSSEDKKRREKLVNEVLARYLKAKTENPTKLPNGTIEKIIEETKKDLDIHDFDVPASSIRGRIHRKSHFVSHEKSNRDDIDDQLVETINSWLTKGLKVTREQGLQFANQLFASKNLDKDSNGKPITLDAVWWKNFLNRNHHKLDTSA